GLLGSALVGQTYLKIIVSLIQQRIQHHLQEFPGRIVQRDHDTDQRTKGKAVRSLASQFTLWRPVFLHPAIVISVNLFQLAVHLTNEITHPVFPDKIGRASCRDRVWTYVSYA